jgi:hypothetical protein
MQLLPLEQGCYAHYLQFVTVHKFCSAVSNIYHAFVEGQSAMVMVKDTKKIVVTECLKPCLSSSYDSICRRGSPNSKFPNLLPPNTSLRLIHLFRHLKPGDNSAFSSNDPTYSPFTHDELYLTDLLLPLCQSQLEGRTPPVLHL